MGYVHYKTIHICNFSKSVCNGPKMENGYPNCQECTTHENFENPTKVKL